MTMLKIAVCDDDKVTCELLIDLIRGMVSGAALTHFTSGEALLTAGGSYDILLLDIQMNGMSGIDVAKQLRQKEQRTTIVFITGLEGHMQDAFDVNAFHYLVKPITKERFREVLGKAIREQEHFRAQAPFLLIKVESTTKKVLLDQILYIDCFNKKLTIHSASESFSYYGKMEHIEQQLGRTFFRCHRSIIISLEQVVGYNAQSVTLMNGTILPMAKPKYATFVKAYLRYVTSGGAVNV